MKLQFGPKATFTSMVALVCTIAILLGHVFQLPIAYAAVKGTSTYAEPTNVTPTLYCLGACPTEEPSVTEGATQAPSTGASIAPTSIATQPPVTAAVSLAPCGSAESNSVMDGKNHVKVGGGFIEAFFAFIIQLLQLLLQMMGGQAPNPTPTPTPNPTAAPNPTSAPNPTPCASPTAAATVPPTIASTAAPTAGGVSPTTATSPTTSPQCTTATGAPTVTIDGVQYPNPLTLKNGNAVTCVSVWESQRRPELIDLFRQNVYGYIPEPTNVTFNATPTTSGTVTFKKVTVNYTGPNGNGSFPFRLFIPKSTTKPKGTFVIIDHRNNASDDPNQNSDYMPVQRLNQAGYAVAAINVGSDVAADDNSNYRSKVINIMIGADKDNAARAVGAWSWSAMRVMDYLMTDPDIDPKKVAVIGHSRSGKAALWAGAQDTRFAAVISNDSGSTGAKLARRGDGGVGGETVKRINDSFPWWFPATYKAYNNNVNGLPVDQHELVALVAPRRAIVASATEDGNADPEGEFLAYVNATPVYALYGLGNNGLGGAGWQPQTGRDYRGDAMSYHLRAGGHGLTAESWNLYMNGNIFDRLSQ